MASSGRDFDPRTRAFSDEELKPQPMIKKSRKQVNEVSALIIPSGMCEPAGSGGTHSPPPNHTLTQYTQTYKTSHADTNPVRNENHVVLANVFTKAL